MSTPIKVLEGRRVLRVDRYAKFIDLELTGGYVLMLENDGQWSLDWYQDLWQAQRDVGDV